MRELGEGMRRIFELMRVSELALPDITSDNQSFSLVLHHRAMYTPEESLWLDQYSELNLSPEEKAVILMGRRGDRVAPNDIIRRLGIIDTEHYRQVVYSLQKKGVLETVLAKKSAQNLARKMSVAVRDVPRFKVVPARDVLRPPGEGGDKIKPELHDVIVKSIYLGNCPPNTTERDILEAFKAFGPINSVRIPTNESGICPGYAFIELGDIESSRRALESEIKLGGRTLTVRWSRPRRGK